MAFEIALKVIESGGAAHMMPEAVDQVKRVAEEALRVRKAIVDEGPVPRVHRRIMRRHREQWPTLWKALDDMVAAIEGAGDEPVRPSGGLGEVHGGES